MSTNSLLLLFFLKGMLAIKEAELQFSSSIMQAFSLIENSHNFRIETTAAVRLLEGPLLSSITCLSSPVSHPLFKSHSFPG